METSYEKHSVSWTAVLQLCERGKLSLDDTLDLYFPEFEYGKDITVYQLLHMQSGLRKDFVTDDTFLDENGNPDAEEFKRYYYDGFTDEELLSMLFSCEPEFKPGTKYATTFRTLGLPVQLDIWNSSSYRLSDATTLVYRTYTSPVGYSEHFVLTPSGAAGTNA